VNEKAWTARHLLKSDDVKKHIAAHVYRATGRCECALWLAQAICREKGIEYRLLVNHQWQVAYSKSNYILDLIQEILSEVCIKFIPTMVGIRDKLLLVKDGLRPTVMTTDRQKNKFKIASTFYYDFTWFSHGSGTRGGRKSGIDEMFEEHMKFTFHRPMARNQ